MRQPAVPTPLVRLIERLGSQEALELEFKAARGGLPNSIWPTISAFANTQGGWLVLGVEERQDELIPTGVTNPPALVKTLHDLLRNPRKISYAVCGATDVGVDSLDAQQVVVIRVPAAPRRTRPVYVNGNPYSGTYVRRHSGDYLCTKAEVDRMMREASDVAIDSTVLKGFGWDDLDPETLARYRRRYQTVTPSSPWNGYDDQRFVWAIGGYRRDRETGQEGLTVAGLLLLGRAEALRQWRSRHLIDYRRLLGDEDADTRWEDRVVWEGNLLGAFETISPRLIERIPVPFRLEGGTRIDEGRAHVALREALVNLLVHADYAETQVSLIKRSPGGYSFRNPGNSRVSEDDLLTGDRSDPRNPRLVQMFRLIGLAEEAGTGMPKIIQAWRELGFQLPAIDVGTERYEFTLQLRYAHLLSADDRAWLLSLGSSWSEAEQLALVVAKQEGYVDNLRLRGLTSQHPADVTKVLGGLRDRGLFQMSGYGRGARYLLPPGLGEPPVTIAALNSKGSESSSEGLVPSSEGLVPSSEGLVPSSEGSGASSEDWWAELQPIARPMRERSHLDAHSRDEIIIQLCARVPLSLRQLAVLLDRREDYLRQILRSLVAAGRLAYLYPNQPNHPRQKYVALSGLDGR